MRTGSRLFALLMSLFFTCAALAQLQPVHPFQQDDTALKREYFQEASQKKKQIIDGLKKENSKDYKEAYNGMFELVEDLLLSSRTVTAPSADNYIKAVAARIINANPELKGLDIRIVFSRDYVPNAYSMGDGTIAFNAGLFVYLNNEAEMAFVLSHELAHYYLEHSKKKIERQITLMNSDSLKRELKRLSKEEYGAGEKFEKLLRTYTFDARRHSRDKEEEADRVGLRFFKNSGYDGQGFITAMQVLDKIDDTALFKPLNLSKTLSFTEYPFKERWIKKESAIFGAMNPDEATGLTKKEKDSLKTHPDCSKRIELLQDAALQINGKNYLVDENLFQQLKQEFIPEIIEEVYKSDNISFNLYLSLQMLQEGKHQPLAIYSIARDLNRIYKHQKDHELGLIVDSENRRYTEGYNQLLRMLYRLRLYEIAEINAAFCNQYAAQMKGYAGFEEEMKKAQAYKQSHQ